MVVARANIIEPRIKEELDARVLNSGVSTSLSCLMMQAFALLNLEVVMEASFWMKSRVWTR